jgi:hypothetical protein
LCGVVQILGILPAEPIWKKKNSTNGFIQGLQEQPGWFRVYSPCPFQGFWSTLNMMMRQATWWCPFWSGCTKHEYLHSDKVVKKKLCFWCRIELSAEIFWAIRTHLRACTLRCSWSTSDMTECFGFVESCWKSWEQTLKP